MVLNVDYFDFLMIFYLEEFELIWKIYLIWEIWEILGEKWKFKRIRVFFYKI